MDNVVCLNLQRAEKVVNYMKKLSENEMKTSMQHGYLRW